MEPQLKILLTSSTPWIQRYDKENKSKRGTFFNEMKRAEMECSLLGPSENDLLHGTEYCFKISTRASFHKEGYAGWDTITGKGKTILEAYESFFKIIRKKTQEGFCISDYEKHINYTLTEDCELGKLLVEYEK